MVTVNLQCYFLHLAVVAVNVIIIIIIIIIILFVSDTVVHSYIQKHTNSID